MTKELVEISIMMKEKGNFYCTACKSATFSQNQQQRELMESMDENGTKD